MPVDGRGSGGTSRFAWRGAEPGLDARLSGMGVLACPPRPAE
jgi:hypothetical protein